MSDEYLWDRSGAVDDFAAELEGRLAPLGDEADALLDELTLLAELEATPASSGLDREGEGEGAVVVALPGAPVIADGGAGSGPSRASWAWLWMSAAAVLLLGISATVLWGEARARQSGLPVQVGGGVDPAARVTVAVTAAEGATPWVALTELRPLHRRLAGCAVERLQHADEAVEVSVRFTVAVAGGDARVESLAVSGGELDGHTQRCLVQTLDDWQPQAPIDGAVNVVIAIE